ncbi:MAG: aldo/keto reductase [Acidobacteriota bacterium]|nr:aldo/keto reductase [Acidobacteriota bacterium]
MSISRIAIAPGYDVSRILKGGWQLAGGHGAIDRAAALDDMARFVDAGITTFDCADIYTGVEELIGSFLRDRRGGVPIQVHTKYVPDLNTLATVTRREVEAAIDRSLARLGVEQLDLVQFHWWDYAVPRYGDVARWLDDCRRAGKIANLGATNFDSRRLRELIAAGVPLVSNQVQYSVIDRRPATAMTALCEDAGIQLLCYGGLAGGFLSDRHLDRPAPAGPLDNRSLVKYRLIIEEFGGWAGFQRLLRALHEVATRHGVTIGTVALRWVLDRPQVAGVIVGARHGRHLADLQTVAALTLTPADLATIASAQAGSAGPSGDVYELERTPGGAHGSIMRYTLNAGPHSPVE